MLAPTILLKPFTINVQPGTIQEPFYHFILAFSFLFSSNICKHSKTDEPPVGWKHISRTKFKLVYSLVLKFNSYQGLHEWTDFIAPLSKLLNLVFP